MPVSGFSYNYHENGVWFPKERNAFVFDHQDGPSDVKCKQAIKEILGKSILVWVSERFELAMVWVIGNQL